jgi:phage FluMu protein Com
MTEQWTEVRCIACVPLGWYSSHLLLRIEGPMHANGVKLQMKCPRCKSLVEWVFGKPEFRIIIEGNRNHRRQTAAFE